MVLEILFKAARKSIFLTVPFAELNLRSLPDKQVIFISKQGQNKKHKWFKIDLKVNLQFMD